MILFVFTAASGRRVGACAELPGTELPGTELTGAALSAVPPGGVWEEGSIGAGEGNPPSGNPPSAAGSGPAAFKLVPESPIADKTSRSLFSVLVWRASESYPGVAFLPNPSSSASSWAFRSSSSVKGMHLTSASMIFSRAIMILAVCFAARFRMPSSWVRVGVTLVEEAGMIREGLSRFRR